MPKTCSLAHIILFLPCFFSAPSTGHSSHQAGSHLHQQQQQHHHAAEMLARRSRRPAGRIRPEFEDMNMTTVVGEPGGTVTLDCNIFMLQDFVVSPHLLRPITAFIPSVLFLEGVKLKIKSAYAAVLYGDLRIPLCHSLR